jgi:hypothetical protein
MTSLTTAARFGAIRFSLASLCVYATVAFGEGWLYTTLGRGGAYMLWTVLFILLGSVALAPLAPDRTRIQFTTLFAGAFLAYAVGWIIAYFTLRGSVGEWIGSFAGCLLMAVVFAAAFRRMHLTQQLFVYLFAANSAGYFLGSILNGAFGGRPGMLLWGVAHGVFFGAGLGAAIWVGGGSGEVADDGEHIENVKKEDVEMS